MMRLTQVAVAREAGISPPLLSMYETGKRRPTPVTVLRILAAIERLGEVKYEEGLKQNSVL